MNLIELKYYLFKQVNDLYASSSAGDISLKGIKSIAYEVGLNQKDIDDLFSDENVGF